MTWSPRTGSRDEDDEDEDKIESDNETDTCNNNSSSNGHCSREMVRESRDDTTEGITNKTDGMNSDGEQHDDEDDDDEIIIDEGEICFVYLC